MESQPGLPHPSDVDIRTLLMHSAFSPVGKLPSGSLDLSKKTFFYYYFFYKVGLPVMIFLSFVFLKMSLFCCQSENSLLRGM